MKRIQLQAEKRASKWIGSSVIHLGDDNVPNALMFIDKYSQVGSILMPICNTLRQIPMLYNKKIN